MDRREVARARHRVIHEGAGQQLPRGGVEADVLHQHLTHALRDAAADLTLEQQRVHDRADIVDDAVAQDLDLAGLRVDLELADMAAVREVLLLAAEGGAGDQAEIHPLGQVFRVQRLPRDFADRQPAVGARCGEEAILELDLVTVGAEDGSGDGLRFGDDLLGREMNRRPAERRRTRAAGAFADRHLVGVALHVMHLIGMDAEPVAEQLLVDRFVPLALGDRARQQRYGAGAVEADFRRLEPARRGALDRVRDAEAAQFAALPRARRGAARTRRNRRGRAPCRGSFRTRRNRK